MEIKQMQCDECKAVVIINGSFYVPEDWIAIDRIIINVDSAGIVNHSAGLISNPSFPRKHFCCKECAKKFVSNYIQGEVEKVLEYFK